MKIQDISFFILLLILLGLRKPIWFVSSGLILLSLSIPLFALQIFFTAERLTWYAAAFFFLFVLFSFSSSYKVK